MQTNEFMSLCSTQENIEADKYYEDLERDAIEKRMRDNENERYEQEQEARREEEDMMDRFRERQNERYERLRCS